MAIEYLLQVSTDIAESKMQSLKRLKLIGDPGRECPDSNVSNVSEEMLNANLFRLFSLNDGRGMNKCSRRGGAIL